MINLSKINKRRHIFIIFIISLSTVWLFSACATNTHRIVHEDEWRVFKGTVEPPGSWNSRGFDDSSWQKSSPGFGYGDVAHNTVLDDMKGNYKIVYARYEFNVKNHHRITRMMLSIVCDGPFVAYLNSINAISSKRPQKGDPLNLIGFAHELDPGINVLSVKCSNDNINSDNYSFIPSFQFNEE